MSASSLIVGLAARTLPRGIRDRYREQWHADVRDAPEAGMRPSSIAVAALAFAVQVGRPFPARRARDPKRSSRLALALALSAALLGLTNYPGISFQGLTGFGVYDFLAFLMGVLLAVFAVLAPIAALVLARGPRVRAAVLLLAVACLAAPAALTIDSGFLSYDAYVVSASYDTYLVPGDVAYLVAMALIVLAVVLVWHPTADHSLLAPVIGALSVWALSAAAIVYAAGVAWPNRTPLVFGLEKGTPLYADWVQLKNHTEGLVVQLFWAAAVAGLLLGVLVFFAGRLMNSRRATALTVTVAAIVLLGASGMFGFLELVMSGTVPGGLLDPLRLAGQILLTATILVAVGGVRYLPRVGHRHDVEGAVELL